MSGSFQTIVEERAGEFTQSWSKIVNTYHCTFQLNMKHQILSFDRTVKEYMPHTMHEHKTELIFSSCDWAHYPVEFVPIHSHPSGSVWFLYEAAL